MRRFKNRMANMLRTNHTYDVLAYLPDARNRLNIVINDLTLEFIVKSNETVGFTNSAESTETPIL